VRRALLDQADELLAFKDIATLRDADVERPPDAPTDRARGAAAARELGMNRLAERLEGDAGRGWSAKVARGAADVALQELRSPVSSVACRAVAAAAAKAVGERDRVDGLEPRGGEDALGRDLVERERRPQAGDHEVRFSATLAPLQLVRHSPRFNQLIHGRSLAKTSSTRWRRARRRRATPGRPTSPGRRSSRFARAIGEQGGGEPGPGIAAAEATRRRTRRDDAHAVGIALEIDFRARHEPELVAQRLRDDDLALRPMR
jgi:hypothetical protein